LLEQRSERLEGIINVTGGDGEERFSYARQLSTQFARNRELVGEVLDLWLSWWRDVLLIKVGCPQFITNADRETMLNNYARGYTLGQIRNLISSIQTTLELLRKNANAQLTLEVLMLNIPGRGE
ncbi:DNA polymerase III subunit delta' C-terminal domain-containing protein, partial [Chloroflexota bacterium]